MTKIGVITDDGETISAHFGRATKCAVFTVADGVIVARELREKSGHGEGHEHQHDHDDHHHGEHDHGHGGGRFKRHLAVMEDCDMVLVRGMGQAAFENLQRVGIKPILTDLKDVETAVQAAIDGDIKSDPRRIHRH